MSQSKLESWIEAFANIVVGFTINFAANMIVLPWFGFNITASKAFWIGVVFTFISLLRSYWLRRLFNKHGNGGWIALWNNLRGKFREQIDLRYSEPLTHRIAKKKYEEANQMRPREWRDK